MLLALCVDVFGEDLLCVASFQREAKPPTLWGCLLLQKYQRSKGTFTRADVSSQNTNERQRNEQPNQCKANERPSTTQLNKRMLESADRRSPSKQSMGVKAKTTTTPRTTSIKKRLYIYPMNLAKI